MMSGRLAERAHVKYLIGISMKNNCLHRVVNFKLDYFYDIYAIRKDVQPRVVQIPMKILKRIRIDS